MLIQRAAGGGIAVQGRIAEWTFEGGPERYRLHQVGTDGFRSRYHCGTYDSMCKVDFCQFEWYRGFYSSQLQHML